MEPPEETLARIEKIIDGAIDAFAEGKPTYHLNLDELQLQIKLSGPSWHGVIEKPVAKFLIDLDAMLADEFKSQGIVLPETNHGLVALQVKEGSWDALLKYSKDAAAAFSSMTPGQQILVAVTVLAAVGIYKASDIIKALKSVQLKKAEQDAEEIRSKERVELVEAVGKIVVEQARLQAPIRSLVNKMDENDKIELPAQEKPLKKSEAKETLAPRPRSSTSVYYIDHRYRIEELSTKDPENWQIGISYGDVSFRAALELDESEVQKLLKDFQEAHEAGSAIAPDLHVNAKISAKGVTSARVVGIGAPRQKAASLSNALKEAKEKAEAERAEASN